MIGYVYNLLAVLAGSTKGAVSKKISTSVNSLHDNLIVNGLRMLICSAIGLAAVLLSGNGAWLPIGFREAGPCLLSACSFSAFVLLWMTCVKGGALVMIDVFQTLGVIIPMIGGILFFQEEVSLRQWLGFPILLVGVFILCSYSNKVSKKITLKQIVLLILCGAANGFSSFSQKLFLHTCAGVPSLIFTFYTYLFAVPIFLALLLFVKRPAGENGEKKKFLTPRLMAGIVIVSVCLFLNLFLRTLAGLTLSSVQIYPMSQGLGIVNSALIASLFFGEPLKKRSVLGIVISIGALLLINL